MLDERIHREVVDPGGEDQIPFLVDTRLGTSLYGSDDIIEYLEEHY